MLKKLVFVVLAAFCCCVWSFSASSVFHFENRMYLKPYPASAAERVSVDSDASYQGHASLRMDHKGTSTTAYTGLHLGLSWFNGLVVGVLGIPGFALLLLVRWVAG